MPKTSLNSTKTTQRTYRPSYWPVESLKGELEPPTGLKEPHKRPVNPPHWLWEHTKGLVEPPSRPKNGPLTAFLRRLGLLSVSIFHPRIEIQNIFTHELKNMSDFISRLQWQLSVFQTQATFMLMFLWAAFRLIQKHSRESHSTQESTSLNEV